MPHGAAAVGRGKGASRGTISTTGFPSAQKKAPAGAFLLPASSEYRDRRADRNIVVNPPDIALVHAHAPVRDRIARAVIIFGIRSRIAQARMEGIARSRIEADHRPHGIGAGRPASRGLVGNRGQAGRGSGCWPRPCRPGRFYQLPVALRAFKHIDMLVGAVDPEQVFGAARIALRVDPDLFFIGSSRY